MRTKFVRNIWYDADIMTNQPTKSAADVNGSGSGLPPFRIEVLDIDFKELWDIVQRPLEVYSTSRSRREQDEIE